MAQQKQVVDKLRQSYPYVDLVFGVDGIDRLPAMLAERLRRGRRYLEEPAQRNAVVEDIPIRRDSGFRAWLPIMYGCDNFCTYCIVPYVRGRERSREPAAVLAEFRQLVAAATRRSPLLGQNVNSYGKGLADPIDFADLLALLCQTPGDYKVRFMTSHPKDASRKLIDTIAANDHLCKHIHLPVQSGSDRVLQAMNRHYTAKQYLDLIDYAKQTIPGVTFSSDIIVGFPARPRRSLKKRWTWCAGWATCSCSPLSIPNAPAPKPPNCPTPIPTPTRPPVWSGCCAPRTRSPSRPSPRWRAGPSGCWWKPAAAPPAR